MESEKNEGSTSRQDTYKIFFEEPLDGNRTKVRYIEVSVPKSSSSEHGREKRNYTRDVYVKIENVRSLYLA